MRLGRLRGHCAVSQSGCMPCSRRQARLNFLHVVGQVARRLEAHPCVSRVHYPGLPSHPDHAIATEQMTGFGGVVSFEVRLQIRVSSPLG